MQIRHSEEPRQREGPSMAKYSPFKAFAPASECCYPNEFIILIYS